MAYSMSFFLSLCDCSVPYWASHEAWNWIVAGQNLSLAKSKYLHIFGIFFLTNFKLSLLLNR